MKAAGPITLPCALEPWTSAAEMTWDKAATVARVVNNILKTGVGKVDWKIRDL